MSSLTNCHVVSSRSMFRLQLATPLSGHVLFHTVQLRSRGHGFLFTFLAQTRPKHITTDQPKSLGLSFSWRNWDVVCTRQTPNIFWRWLRNPSVVFTKFENGRVAGETTQGIMGRRQYEGCCLGVHGFQSNIQRVCISTTLV